VQRAYVAVPTMWQNGAARGTRQREQRGSRFDITILALTARPLVSRMGRGPTLSACARRDKGFVNFLS